MRLLLSLLLLVFALPAAAQDERILSFVSDVRIEKSGTLDVTETIRVRSTGEEIKRGIQRDFPTRYRNKLGQTTSTTFDVLSVERDGKPENYELISLSNGQRVRIGRAEVFLEPGEHRFVIRYRTSRQLLFLADKDEIYWNATGTGWTFPIDMAEARITLPSPAAFGDRMVYTGPQGATDGRDARVVEETPGRIVFRTTQPLGREEGLTVAVAFPKGVVDAPSATDRASWWLADWGALGAAGIALLGLAAYYFHAWRKAGRNPRAGTLVPRFSPPEGISAAAARHIMRMGSDNRGFTAAVVQLAVDGRLRIVKADGGWLSRDQTRLERTDASDKGLGSAERAMYAALFGGGRTIELKQENHARLSSARSALNGNIKAAYDGVMYRSNAAWATYGLLAVPFAVLFVAFVAIAFRVPPAHPAELSFALVGLVGLTLAVWLHGRGKKLRGAKRVLMGIAGFLMISLGLFAAFGAVITALADGQWAVLLPLLGIPLAISAYSWMFAPTAEGRAMMDQIAGFKHYLGVTEEDRLETLHPPEKTPELFERYLPYAIALDVENSWAKRFSGVLAAAAASGAAAHTMGWYSGSGNAWDDPSSFVSSVGSTLNSTISSAATAPSSSGSSGGSSGGGSSGGGGGGGGGSGW